MRGARTLAVAGAAALVLTACSGDGGSGLGPDASPEEVVAAGLGDRLENGASFTLTMDGDLDAIAERMGEPAPEGLQELMAEGLVTGAFSPDGGVALSLGADGGFLEVRAVEEALYLRLDLEKVTATFPDAGELPSPEVLRGQLEGMALPPDLSAVAEAALDGQWVGITGLSQQALEDLANSMGGGVPSEDASQQEEAVRSILEDKGLLDGQTLTERYLTVEGDGPTYDLTVMARDLVTTLNEVAAELESSLGSAAGDMGELPDATTVPETLTGFRVTIEDGTATAIAADVAEIATSAGEDVEGLESGDLVITMTLDDIGNELDAPDATTIDFEALITGVMGGLMGGGLGGGGLAG